MAENGAVSTDEQRDGLRSFRRKFLSDVEVVCEGDVLGEEVITENGDRGGLQRASHGPMAVIEDDDCFSGISRGAFDAHVGLADRHDLAIDTGTNVDDASVFGQSIDGILE